MISFAAVVLSSALVLAPAPAQQGHMLRVKLTKGQIVKHNVVMKTVVPGANGKSMNVTIDMLVRQTCKTVNGNKFTIESGVDRANMQVPGIDPKMVKSQTDAMLKQKTTTVMDSQGKVISNSGVSMSSMNNPTSFPAGPVKVGGTWSSEVNMPSQMGQLKMKVTNKLLALEKVAGRDCYKISLNMSGSGAMDVSGGGTMWVRVADGLPEKGSFTNKMKMKGGQNGQSVTINVTTSLSRA